MQQWLSILILVAAVPLSAETSGAWHVDSAKHRVFSRPSRLWDAGESGVYISCANGTPSVAIQVRDPIPSTTDVRLQFGGHGSFLGKDGVIKDYKFTRGAKPLVAIANAHDALEIVRELLTGHSRLAYLIDTNDGFDTLEVRTGGFAAAWRTLQCPGFGNVKTLPNTVSPPGTFKVAVVASYPATTEHDAFTDRDTFDVPFSSTCGSRFRLDRVGEETDFRDRERIARSFNGPAGDTDIHVTITKLFAGRGAEPSLVISAGANRSELPFTKSIDLQAWPTSGYKIRGKFSPRDLPMAKFWTKLELRCTE